MYWITVSSQGDVQNVCFLKMFEDLTKSQQTTLFIIASPSMQVHSGWVLSQQRHWAVSIHEGI